MEKRAAIRFLGNHTSLALEQTKRIFNHAKSFRVVEEGQENLVIIVDDAFTVRFPRSDEIWERGETERRVLMRLADSTLPIPKVTDISEDPAYIVLSYLRGVQLTTERLRSLPTSQLELIGKDIATIAYALHEKLNIAEFEPLIQPPSWSYDEYLKRELFDKSNDNPRVDALAKEYYKKWMQKPRGSRKVVIHDDLHMGNLLFDDSYRISGILDFGAVCIGTPEQELRQTYHLGDAGFEAAISTYEKLSGLTLNRELAKAWTVTQELASYCRDDTETVHARARENLSFWFPELFEDKK